MYLNLSKDMLWDKMKQAAAHETVFPGEPPRSKVL